MRSIANYFILSEREEKEKRDIVRTVSASWEWIPLKVMDCLLPDNINEIENELS